MKSYNLVEFSENEWNSIIHLLPNPHFLQTSEWGGIKSSLGWCPTYLVWKSNKNTIVAGAMILEKRVGIRFLPINIAIQYVPRGPLVDWKNSQLVEEVLDDISAFSRHRKVIFIKIDPEVICGSDFNSENINQLAIEETLIKNQFIQRNWNYSKSQIQFKNSVWIDILQNEEQILSRMKQKTRYNIRLSEKKGVKIRVATQNEFATVYQLYAETSIRDHFVIRSEDYYLRVWKTFSEKNICDILVAEYEGAIISALVLYYFGSKAYYVYGMSANIHRNLMATYLIQWEAIKIAKKRGLKIYDLWGAPSNLSESDPMWGVYRFKLGLGGELVQSIGAWDYSSRKFSYFLYENILPILLKIFRFIGRKKT